MQYIQKQELKERQAKQLGFDYKTAPYGGTTARLVHNVKPSALSVDSSLEAHNATARSAKTTK
jgi:hypothetical protein